MSATSKPASEMDFCCQNWIDFKDTKFVILLNSTLYKQSEIRNKHCRVLIILIGWLLWEKIEVEGKHVLKIRNVGISRVENQASYETGKIHHSDELSHENYVMSKSNFSQLRWDSYDATKCEFGLIRMAT